MAAADLLAYLLSPQSAPASGRPASRITGHTRHVAAHDAATALGIPRVRQNAKKSVCRLTVSCGSKIAGQQPESESEPHQYAAEAQRWDSKWRRSRQGIIQQGGVSVVNNQAVGQGASVSAGEANQRGAAAK